MYTLYVLVRNFDLPGELRFRDFQIREIRQGNLEMVREMRERLRTEDVNYGDALLIRQYENAPPAPGQNPAGVGRIPLDAEDVLLLLRLFKPGDISFARLGIEIPQGRVVIQSSYRVISDLIVNAVFPYSMSRRSARSGMSLQTS